MMKEILKTLKSLADKRREKSLIQMRKYDDQYEEAMDRVVALSEEYGALALKEDEKGIIERLLEALDDVEREQVNLAYVAGLADCLLILDRLELFEL